MTWQDFKERRCERHEVWYHREKWDSVSLRNENFDPTPPDVSGNISIYWFLAPWCRVYGTWLEWTANQMHSKMDRDEQKSREVQQLHESFIISMYCCQHKTSIFSLYFPHKWCSFRCGCGHIALLVTTGTHWLQATRVNSWISFGFHIVLWLWFLKTRAMHISVKRDWHLTMKWWYRYFPDDYLIKQENWECQMSTSNLSRASCRRKCSLSHQCDNYHWHFPKENCIFNCYKYNHTSTEKREQNPFKPVSGNRNV